MTLCRTASRPANRPLLPGGGNAGGHPRRRGQRHRWQDCAPATRPCISWPPSIMTAVSCCDRPRSSKRPMKSTLSRRCQTPSTSSGHSSSLMPLHTQTKHAQLNRRLQTRQPASQSGPAAHRMTPRSTTPRSTTPRSPGSSQPVYCSRTNPNRPRPEDALNKRRVVKNSSVGALALTALTFVVPATTANAVPVPCVPGVYQPTGCTPIDKM